MKHQKKSVNKGFTLIELLVVIAIIAVLAVVVILTLNPAGLLQEARDSNRISDMATLKSALSLYLADVPSPSLGSNVCYVAVPQTPAWAVTIKSNSPSSTQACNAWMVTTGASSTVVVTTGASARAIGTTTASTAGWIPVPLGLISAGNPFPQWPIDPTNNNSYFYSYTASTSTGSPTFKIAMFMESSKYEASGTADVESTDGGQNNYVFEGGSNLNL